MTTSRVLAPIGAARGMTEGLYCCVEVADALGVSPATLRRAARSCVELAPTRIERLRGVDTWLFDLDVVNRLAEHVASRRRQGPSRGRPRLWDADERRERRARHSAAHYRRRRAEVLACTGDAVGAVRARMQADAITAGLRTEALIRSGERMKGARL